MKLQISLSSGGKEAAIRMRVENEQDDFIRAVRESLKEMAAKIKGRFYVEDSGMGRVLILRQTLVENPDRKIEMMFGFENLRNKPVENLSPSPLLQGRVLNAKGDVLFQQAPTGPAAPAVSTVEQCSKMAMPLRRWMHALTVQANQPEK